MYRPRRWERLHPVWVWAARGTAFLVMGAGAANGLRIELIHPPSGEVSIQFHPDAGDESVPWDVFRCENGSSWSLVDTRTIDSGGPLPIPDPSAGVRMCWFAAANAMMDHDSDALSDGREFFLFGSDPNLADTDGDGLTDGPSGVVPVSAVPHAVDRDGDGFADGEEAMSSSPTDTDSDGDGIDDGAEWINRTDPLTPDVLPPTVVLNLSPSPLWLMP